MDFYCYLRIEPYLAEWYIHENGGNPVRLKRGSAESDILELLLQRQPPGREIDLGRDSNVSIVIPHFRYKDPATFNYLSPMGKKALARTIYTRFRVQLWNDLYKLDNTEVPLTDLIYAWMELHGITCDEKNWETIRQHYFRKRKVYRDNLAKKSSKFKPDCEQQ